MHLYSILDDCFWPENIPIDGGIKMINPSFSALFALPKDFEIAKSFVEFDRYFFPLFGSFIINNLDKDLVFFLSPRSFGKVHFEKTLPSEFALL